MGELDYVEINQVNDPDVLARYIQQKTGTPWPTWKDRAILRKKCKEFFEHYPHLDYRTLCHVADWCARKKRRFSNVWKVIDAFRFAYEDGALPEVDRGRIADKSTDERIQEALEVETDSMWRSMLIGTQDVNVRKEVLEQWLESRKPLLTSRAS